MALVWTVYLSALWASGLDLLVLGPLGVVPILCTGLVLGLAWGLALPAALIGAGLAAAYARDPAAVAPLANQAAGSWALALVLGATSGVAGALVRRSRSSRRTLAAEVERRRKVELDFRETELRFRQVAETMQEVFWLRDVARGDFVYVSPAFAALWGRDPLDVAIDPGAWLDSVHPDDRLRLSQALTAERLASGYDLEYRLVRPDGSVRWVHDRAFPVDAGPGLPVERVAGIAADVTDRHAAVLALEQAVQRLFAIVRSSPFPIVHTDRAGRIRTWNAAAERLVGWTAQDAAGQRLAFAVSGPARADAEAAMAAAARGSPQQRTLTLLHRDGGAVPAELHLQPVLGRSRGDGPAEVEGIVAVLADQRERLLREEQDERLRALLDRLGEGYLSVDLTTGKAAVSPAVERILGLPRQVLEQTPRQWRRLVVPEDRAVTAHDRDRNHAGQDTETDFRIRRPDGAVRWLHASMHPVRGPDGRVVRIDGILRDQTAEREAEQQRRRVKELEDVAAFKTRFLTSAAHELSTPLTPIKLQMAYLRRALSAADEGNRKSVELLERNLGRLGTLVQDLLDAAGLQNGRLRMDLRHVDLGNVVRDVQASFGPKTESDGLQLRVTVPKEPVFVTADDARIHQVLTNLIHNACKFTPRGGAIELRLRRDGACARLEVKDSGIGLEPEQARQLFQPFVQVHDRTQLQVGGTGLGLYISRAIAQQLGGDLTCQSEGTGKGATFGLRIPLAGTAAA